VLAPWKAKCMQTADDHHKPSFLKGIKPQTIYELFLACTYNRSGLFG